MPVSLLTSMIIGFTKVWAVDIPPFYYYVRRTTLNVIEKEDEPWQQELWK
jgi:hypothetical protein